MKLDGISNQIYIVAFNEAKLQSHEFLTPEHFLYAAAMFDAGKAILEESGGGVKEITAALQSYFDEYLTVPQPENAVPIESFAFIKMFEMASIQAENSGRQEIGIGDLLVAILNLPESFAVHILYGNGVDKLKMLRYISHEMKKPTGKETKTDQDDGKKKAKNAKDILRAFTTDLTEKAREGALDPLVGREDVLERTVHALCRRLKNNPVHVGDAGVGKTAIVEGLAQMIAAGNAPKKLIGATIFYLDMGTVVAGTKYRGDFEERLISILDACMSVENPIVYIDEIHSIIGAGAVNGGALDAAGILKPYLQNGKLRFIGSTTYDEYKKRFEKDNALMRRFQSIEVPEPSVDETEKILLGVKHKYEDFHGVAFDEETISNVSRLAAKYINDRRLPDKAIDVLDETGAYLRVNNPEADIITVTLKDVERTIALMAKVPENSVAESESDDLKTLAQRIKLKVYGQDEAVDAVVTAVCASRAGLSEPEKPVASLLFVGPTGVGKTEIARQLSDCLRIKLLRFDMSEYQESHSVARLIGSPPGYVGYDEGGLLTDAVRKTPHAVLLLDEVEKAHPDILNVLLQVMDYGALTDNSGKKADFRNIILIMTSNAGAKELGKRIIGYDDTKYDIGAIDREVRRLFSPEFRNRLDEIIVFRNIDREMAMKITKKALEGLRQKLLPKGITIGITRTAAEWVAEKGLSQQYGAREIMRIVNKEIMKQLIPAALYSKDGGHISIFVRKDKIRVSRLKKR